MRDYGKVYTSYWTTALALGFTDDAKLLGAYLLSCGHTNMIGCFRLPDGYVSEDLGWTLERVSKGFAELSEKGFAKRCETSKWVVVLKFLKWNELENPNQGKAAAKLFGQIPDSVPLKSMVAAALQEFSPRVDATVYAGFLNPSVRVPQGFPNQKPEQEQKPDQDQKPATRAGGPPSRTEVMIRECVVDHADFIAEHFPDLDVAVETEMCVTKYRSQSIGADPWLIVLRWFQNSKEAADGKRRSRNTGGPGSPAADAEESGDSLTDEFCSRPSSDPL